MTAPSDATAAQLNRASALVDLGRHADASALLKRVIASDPNNSRAWCLLARAQLGDEQVAEALTSAGRAVALDPEEEWGHRLASLALTRLSRHVEAAQAAREAIRLAPHVWQGYVRLATALLPIGGALTEAQAVVEHAVWLAPEEADTHLGVGAVAAAAGRRADAEAAYRRALAIDPQHSAAHNELARLRLSNRLGGSTGLAAAAGGFATAVRVDPRASVSRHNLELVLRVFLARVCYFIFLDAWIATAAFDNPVGRALPVLLLVVPVIFAGRFLHGLKADLRRFLRQLLRGPIIRFAVAADGVAVGCLVAQANAPLELRTGLAGGAFAAALLARILVWVDRNRAQRASGRSSGRGLSTWVLWVLAVALALLVVSVLSTLSSPDGSLAVKVGLTIALLAGLGVTLYAIWRRSGGRTSRQ